MVLAKSDLRHRAALPAAGRGPGHGDSDLRPDQRRLAAGARQPARHHRPGAAAGEEPGARYVDTAARALHRAAEPAAGGIDPAPSRRRNATRACRRASCCRSTRWPLRCATVARRPRAVRATTRSTAARRLLLQQRAHRQVPVRRRPRCCCVDQRELALAGDQQRQLPRLQQRCEIQADAFARCGRCLHGDTAGRLRQRRGRAARPHRPGTARRSARPRPCPAPPGRKAAGIDVQCAARPAARRPSRLSRAVPRGPLSTRCVPPCCAAGVRAPAVRCWPGRRHPPSVRRSASRARGSSARSACESWSNQGAGVRPPGTTRLACVPRCSDARREQRLRPGGQAPRQCSEVRDDGAVLSLRRSSAARFWCPACPISGHWRVLRSGLGVVGFRHGSCISRYSKLYTAPLPGDDDDLEFRSGLRSRSPSIPVSAEVTARIRARSADGRARDYLERMARAPTTWSTRAALGCTNLAHAIASASGPDRQGAARRRLAEHRHRFGLQRHALGAPALSSAIPALIKTAAREAGAVAQFAGGVPAMCDGVTQGTGGMELSLFSRDVIAMSTAIALSHGVFDARAVPGHLRQDRAGPADRRAGVRPPAGDLRAGRADALGHFQRGEVARPPAVRAGQGRTARRCSNPRCRATTRPAPAPSTAPPTATRC